MTGIVAQTYPEWWLKLTGQVAHWSTDYSGRKNFLFHTSVDGAVASSVIYSLVETAKANNLNVFQYIYTLLLYMPGCKNRSEGIEQLMPWSDFIKEHCSGLIDVETVTVEEHPELPIE